MTSKEQPAQPSQYRSWILTEEKWNELREHLDWGCTNQAKFLASLESHDLLSQQQRPAPEEEDDGCYACDYLTDAPMGPNYCTATKPHRLVIGYSRKSCQIPEGKNRPDWCPHPLSHDATIAAAAITQERERIRKAALSQRFTILPVAKVLAIIDKVK